MVLILGGLYREYQMCANILPDDMKKKDLKTHGRVNLSLPFFNVGILYAGLSYSILYSHMLWFRQISCYSEK